MNIGNIKKKGNSHIYGLALHSLLWFLWTPLQKNGMAAIPKISHLCASLPLKQTRNKQQLQNRVVRIELKGWSSLSFWKSVSPQAISFVFITSTRWYLTFWTQPKWTVTMACRASPTAPSSIEPWPRFRPNWWVRQAKGLCLPPRKAAKW